MTTALLPPPAKRPQRIGKPAKATMPESKDDPLMEGKVSGHLCPYCGQKLPKGVPGNRPKGLNTMERRGAKNLDANLN